MVRNTNPNEKPYDKLNKTLDFWHPEDIGNTKKGEPILNDKQVDQFINDGFVVLKNLWPQELIEKAKVEAMDIVKPFDVSNPRAFNKAIDFPFPEFRENKIKSLNYMSIHPRVLSICSQLLSCDIMDLRLSQSHIIGKLGKVFNRPGHKTHGQLMGDQDIHVDYGNNTLVVPPKVNGPEAVAILCYYSDVEECGGATHFAKALPGELTTSTIFNPPNFVFDLDNEVTNGDDNSDEDNVYKPRSKENINRLLNEEKPVYYSPGTCVVYRMDSWHRGTPVLLNKFRHTHHHVIRKKDSIHHQWQSFAPKMALMPRRFLETLSVEQRTAITFPEPGHSYWTPETLHAVGKRYPNMDMTPYYYERGGNNIKSKI